MRLTRCLAATAVTVTAMLVAAACDESKTPASPSANFRLRGARK